MRPDPEFDPATVRSLLTEELEERDGSIELLGRGWDCDVYLLDGARVVRVAHHAEAARGMERETQLLPLLAPQLPLPVSVPLRVRARPDDATLALGVYAWIPGRALCELELEPDDYDLLAPTLGQFLRALHGATLPADRELPADSLGRLDPSRRSANARQIMEQLLWEGALTRGQRARLESALDEAERSALRDERVPVHGDLHACNLLVNEDGFAGVIDWIDLHAGHPAVDLSAVYLSLPPHAHAALFEAYGSHDASARAWALWRAITTLCATTRGAMERGWGERSHHSALKLAALGSQR